MTAERFGGHIGRTYKESEPWWPPHTDEAGESRPNVVVVLLDDTGFANLGCYGSTIDTPNLDALAANGLRFSNFHVTPLCSPTRASLMTGRNHHAVGMRTVANYHDGGYPNQRGSVSRHAATMAEILQESGYATYALGKWHLCPSEECSAAGPFNDWPLQRGFDRFYGFLPGATDQFYPELTEDNHHIDPPGRPEDGYHVTEDLVDQALDFLRDKQSHRPKQPFFLYFALGAMHEPHQAPPEYLRKYRGRFDAGWDAVRQGYYERQLELGIIPPGTALAPRNPGVEPWDALPDNQQRFMRRLQETFAAFLDHTDAQIGRIVQHLDESGQLDNTIFLVLADNGTSQGGGPTGVMYAGSGSGRRATNDGQIAAESERGYPRTMYQDDVDAVDLDLMGGPRSFTDIPWGWAQVGNTPLRWYKHDVHGGGVRVPLIVHWPARITEPGIRHQFHHVSDVMPTVLDLLDVAAPETYRGIDQMPVTGTGFAYTFERPDEDSRKPVQYFECDGHRGIWADGWKAVTRHTLHEPFNEAEWELYHVAEDFAELNDLALEEPERLRQLVDLWWVEAGRNGVLPLDDRTFALTAPSKRPGSVHEELSYRYTPPVSHLPSGVAPPMGVGEWVITAEVVRADTGVDGVLFVAGSMNAGLSFYVQDNRLHFAHNARTKITTLHSSAVIAAGRVTLEARLVAERGDGPGRIEFRIDGRDAGGGEIVSLAGGAGRGGADIGANPRSPVTADYEAPFAFGGRIRSLDIVITPFPVGGIPAKTPEERSMEE